MKSADGIAGLVCCVLAAWSAGCSDNSPKPVGPTTSAGAPALGGAPSGGGGATAGGAGSTTAGGGADAGGSVAGDDVTDPLAALPTGAVQLEALCARNHGDQVALAFCQGGAPPSVGSLRELQLLLGLDLTNPLSAMGALVTQSTSIARRLTTPINPRAIVFTMTRPLGTSVNPEGSPQPNPTWVTMAFARGEQFVELASKDPTANDEVRFYLFNFRQECNDAAGGCTPGDLFTPDGEKNFTSYSLYEDVDLANTSLDCAQCHQQQGPGTRKVLLNQTYGYDWGHWAIRGTLIDESVVLCDKFSEAHAADEDYAGIPNAYLGCTKGPGLNDIGGPSIGGPQAIDQFLYDNGFALDLENAYAGKVGKAIFSEVKTANPQQPELNVPIGVSAIWQNLFDSYVPGQSLEVPYHDLLNTDPQKLSAAIDAYRGVMAGTRPKSELPDLGDLLLEAGLADMSIRPQPGLSGRQILTAMCQQCHNSTLDQSLSRAHFDVQKLDQMSRAQKDEAIRRLQLPPTSARHMPPRRFHELSAADIELVTQELRQ
jgi:hypothetical protein